MNTIIPPQNDRELMLRCQTLAGKRLGELAALYHQKIPTTLIKDKGFIGQLIEMHLGGGMSNLPGPDFPNLGIELKTLPLNADGTPRESTYVCTAPLGLQAEMEHWENSRVREKLACVLWVPIEAEPTIPICDRHIGTPILWRLDPKTEKILRQDWEELTLMLRLGQINSLSARIGTYLQIRPKAAHSRILTTTLDEEGEEIFVNPKGFYLRSLLTQKILETHYCKV